MLLINYLKTRRQNVKRTLSEHDLNNLTDRTIKEIKRSQDVDRELLRAAYFVGNLRLEREHDYV